MRQRIPTHHRRVVFAPLLILCLVGDFAVLPAWAQTYTVLHTFTGAPDGGYPNPLIRDEQGVFYGTTYGGGLPNCPSDSQGACGTVFKMDRAGKVTLLFDFPGGSGGSNPLAAVVRDGQGNLYGTTQGNGAFGGDSVVFKIDPSGQETVLLTGGPNAESFDSPLALDAQGNLYGMSPYGGDPHCPYVSNNVGGCGTLFKISPRGEFTLLHVFQGEDGVQPEGGLVFDAKGNLYGTAVYGGIYSCEYPGYGQPREHGCGTVYRLDTKGKFSVLHTFTGPGDGSYPLGVIADLAGNLYGIAESGGIIASDTDGMGTVFKVDASGKFSVLFIFSPLTTVNHVYASRLVRDSKGMLYGLQQENNCAKGGGCLFRIDKQGKYTDLYDFQGYGEGDDGNRPVGVILSSDGEIYGSMNIGGFKPPPPSFCSTYGCGTLFHLSAP